MLFFFLFIFTLGYPLQAFRGGAFVGDESVRACGCLSRVCDLIRFFFFLNEAIALLLDCAALSLGTSRGKFWIRQFCHFCCLNFIFLLKKYNLMVQWLWIREREPSVNESVVLSSFGWK